MSNYFTNMGRDSMYGNSPDKTAQILQRMGEVDLEINDVKKKAGNHAESITALYGEVDKLKGGTSSGKSADLPTYVIELNKWGITKGIPNKPYTNNDFTQAKNNIVGINEALKYAYDNGYKTVSLPNGSYSLCYGEYLDTDGKKYTLTIYPQKDTVIDFCNATLRVIYDSDKLSPYNPNTASYNCPKCGKSVIPKSDGYCPTLNDPVVGNCGNFIGFWGFAGTAITVKEPNVQLRRIKLLGDRLDRSFSSYYNCINNYPGRDTRTFSEAGVEYTVGVRFANRANGCSITESDVAFFMGDNIATQFQDNTTLVKYPSDIVGDFTGSSSWGVKFGSVDFNTGADTAGSGKDIVTNFITIPVNVDSFSLIGLGYSPRTSIPNFQYNIVFYDTNKKLISSYQKARTVDIVNIPPKGKYMKITFLGNGTLDDGAPHAPYWMQLVSNGISSNILIARNKIRGGHRGGIFLGGNNVNIEYNELVSNGSTSDLYGLVMFPFMTRYGINSEDNVGQNYKINNNVFVKSRIAIAVRGEYVEILGNEFRQNDVSLILYRLYHATISQNVFIGTDGVLDFPYNEPDFIRNWKIVDNTFVGSNINITGTSPITLIESNSFYDSVISVSCPVYRFSENMCVVKAADRTIFLASGNNIDNCSFIGNSNYKCIINGSANVNNCYLSYSSVSYTPGFYGGSIRGTKFSNSSIALGFNNGSLIPVKVNNSTFDFTISTNVIPSGATVGVNVGYSVEFNNCSFSNLQTTAFGMQNISDISLSDCKFGWVVQSATNNLLFAKYIYNVNQANLYNCELKSNIDSTQDLTLFNNGCNLDFVKLDKFTFTTRTKDVIRTGNIHENMLKIVADIEKIYFKLPPIAVTGVSVSPNTLTAYKDDVVTLTATVSPANADNLNVTWSSSDVSTATVSSSGTVTCLKAGTVDITATTVDKGFTASSRITINPVDYNAEAITNFVNRTFPHNTTPVSVADNMTVHGQFPYSSLTSGNSGTDRSITFVGNTEAKSTWNYLFSVTGLIPNRTYTVTYDLSASSDTSVYNVFGTNNVPMGVGKTKDLVADANGKINELTLLTWNTNTKYTVGEWIKVSNISLKLKKLP